MVLSLALTYMNYRGLHVSVQPRHFALKLPLTLPWNCELRVAAACPLLAYMNYRGLHVRVQGRHLAFALMLRYLDLHRLRGCCLPNSTA